MRHDGRRYIEATIRNRAFSLVYQPILHLDAGTFSGVEALCRFHDGRPPDTWFRQCEAIGLGPDLDIAIIGKAVEDLERLPPGYLALNLSASTLAVPGDLRRALQPLLDAKPLVLELTEHMIVADYDTVAETLGEFRDAGVRFAVDDAGAGYSTFQHILRLRPDIIKLDRSITSGIDVDPAKQALTHALVIFAGEIGASVVAEGIETEEELTALRTTGVTRGQGFWLAKPHALPLPPVGYEPRRFLDLVECSSAVGADMEMTRVPNGPDPTVAVIAHGLLTSLACVSSAVEVLRARDGNVPVEELRALTSVMRSQVDLMSGTVRDLVLGLPAEARNALDDLVGPSARR
jgi:EAL domain-containing protein (putative c-di-GMP-specific phosphodiesterase class I)